ncbi:hypothetical protein J4467_01220 [Candidatus Woesearchaeota archaeon]|nr:hypothetical protein [Candidatus Woesearchaeota archaeon]
MKKPIKKKSVKRKAIGKKSNKGLSVLSLLLNIVIWPGLGTLVSRKFGTGVLQMILSLVGLALMYVMPAAMLIVLIAWIWALVSSVRIIMEAWK